MKTKRQYEKDYLNRLSFDGALKHYKWIIEQRDQLLKEISKKNV